MDGLSRCDARTSASLDASQWAHPREVVLARLWTQPLLRSDVIALYTGDGEERVAPCVEAFRQGVAPCILIIGGTDDPPYARQPEQLKILMHARGIAPRVVRVVSDARHTRACADALVRAVQEHDWKRITLVVSAYHVARAFLATLAALDAAGLADTVYCSMLAGGFSQWSARPAGRSRSRIEVFDDELSKCAHYIRLGECATWLRAEAYLDAWERRP